MKNFELKLHIDPSITPVQQPIRRLPYHTRHAVSSELKRLLELDVIEPVKGPTTWLNPVVAVNKNNSKIRLCLDMRKANTAIKRERHVIPILEDILPDLHKATVFSKIDLHEGYHQLVLLPDSRHITAFATHEGVHQYRRLTYGVNSAFESFQKQIEIAITGCKGTKNVSDDILIWGRNQEDHDNNLDQVLSRLLSAGLKVNKEKCVFSVDNIVFGGHCLSKDGITPDQSKLNTIQQIKRPLNATEVRSFLGIVNYCHRFIPGFSTIAEPLRQLTKKSKLFIWTQKEEGSFQKLKQALLSPTVLRYYNPSAETIIITDASPVGLGTILSQRQQNSEFQPVSYAS